MDTLPVWKRIYPVIASKNPHVTEDIVEDVLDICKGTIVDVFLQYEEYSKESFLQWKEQLGVKEIVSDDEMCNFIHKLSRRLDLNSNVAWTVICNFLMYEYYGVVDELKTLIKFAAKIEYLTENIWYFYTADRMFLLKTLRHILESADVESDAYHEEIYSFVKNLSISQLWKNLIKVFHTLIHEICKDKIHMVSEQLLREWIHRNDREQVEVLLLLTQTLQRLTPTGSELEEIFALFIRHGFTRNPVYTGSIHISKAEDLCQVKNAEIALLLAVMDKYWKLHTVDKKLPENLARNLEFLQLQGDNNIIMFAYTVFKLSRHTNTDDDMEKYNAFIEQMLSKKVFVSIYEVMTHRMFLDSKPGEILANSVYNLLVEFSNVCGDFMYMHEQDGMGKLVAELLKRKGLMVLDTLGPIYQLSMDSFPFAFIPFLEICKPLLSMPDKFEGIMKLIRSLPTFLAEIFWSHHQNQYFTDEVLKLFIDSELFMIPEGTLVEKFVYQGMEFSKFHHRFSFFLLMEQFTKSLNTISFEIGPNWHCYKNLTELVHVGFRFIKHILKCYKGDYRNDKELRTLVQRLEIVPAQFCEGQVKNFDFIKIYFSVNCTLVIRELLDYMEAFPLMQRKKFMPTVVNYSKETRSNLFIYLHNKSILFTSLKEEENQKTHDLLIQYLELIYFMVQKDIYHYEVQLAGLCYILNSAFPLHQQWDYKDPLERVIISKLCYLIFIEILQKHLLKVNEEPLYIFEMVLDSFFYEDITVSSYMTLFSKDKFFLQNIMEEESNWNSGPALETLELLRLQMVLLLLLYKHKSKRGRKNSVLDINVGFFAKAVTPYIINPYSLALRKLSCRFLQLLAKDQNVPLMALLGLDYDQIQRLYLDRLRDSTEDDDLKMYILDLIGTCVVYQHGMTAAFFNVKRSRKWYSDNKENTIEGDTVCDFMVDYLQNIKKSPQFLKSPLQIGILHIMANLWSSRKRHLIDDVVNLDEFWPLLSNPLYREFDQLPTVYAYIFRIFGIQLIELQNDTKYLSSIEKFITDKKQVKAWIEYIWSTFKLTSPNIEDVEDREFLLRSWLEFLIMLEKTKELKKFDEDSKFEFMSMAFDGVTLPLVNMYCLKLWTELILLQLAYWKIRSESDSKILAPKVITCLCIIKTNYNYLEHSARLAMLTIVQQILENLKGYFQSALRDLLEFLEHFGAMLDFEYTLLEEKQWNTNQDVFDTTVRETLLPWMMCVRIVTGLFELKNIEEIGSWFTYRKLVQKFMNSTCELMQHPPTLPLAKVILHSLAVYADSPLYFDFLYIDIGHFFVKIEAPISGLLFGQNNKIVPLHLEEGWITYSLLIKYLTAYFNSLKYLALPNCFIFISLCEQILGHIFNILETTVTLKALDVVINTLIFFDSIMEKWQIEWYRKSNTTYNFILNGTKRIIKACLYAILRPKNILVYKLDDSNRFIQIEKYPVDLMVIIVNRLVTAVGLGLTILYRANPNLTTLLDPCIPDTVVVLIDSDFSVPKFELPISTKLTYGMLLCLAHFLCKTIDALKLNKKSTTSTVHPEFFTKCFAMMEHQGFSDNRPTQKLSAFLRYAMHEYSGLADPWIQKLDSARVQYSLEMLMLFLAQQIYIAVETAPVENEIYFKRNLSSELQFFYEHVKKITSNLINSTTTPTLSPACRAETDVLKRYLLYYKETNAFNEVADNNFCITISYWFTNICKLK